MPFTARGDGAIEGEAVRTGVSLLSNAETSVGEGSGMEAVTMRARWRSYSERKRLNREPFRRYTLQLRAIRAAEVPF